MYIDLEEKISLSLYKLRLESREERNRYLLLASLTLIFLVLGMYFSSKIPLWHDEAVQANAALSLLENGIPNFPSGAEYWRALPQTILSATSAAILGSSDLALRLPSIISGAITMILTYLLSRKAFNRRVGLIAAAFLTFSGWQIALTTQVRMYALLQLLYLGSIFLIYRTGKELRARNIILLTATVTVGILVHLTAAILPFIAVIYLYLNNPEIFDYRKIIALLISAGTLLLSYTLYLGHLPILNRLAFRPENFGLYLSFLSKELPVLFYLGLIGSLIGLKENIRGGFLILLASLPAFCVYSFHYSGIAERYIHFLLPFLAVWTGLSINKLSSFLADKTGRLKAVHILIVLVPALIALGSGLEYNFEENSYRPYFSNEKAYGYVESNFSQGDVFIDKWSASAYYYFKAPDYALYGKSETKYNSFNGVEEYTGAQFLRNVSSLNNVVEENDRGWVVLRSGDYRLKSEEIQQRLSDVGRVKEYDTLVVWHWNQSYYID